MGLPSIGTFLGGIGAILGKASTYIPGRIEKLKNEKVALEAEEAKIEILILDVDKEEDRKKAVRLADIKSRIKFINSVLGNKATD